MSNIEDLIKGLTDPDDKKAYACLKKLEERSNRSSIVYPFFDTFAEMLASDNSYIRTRGLLLIAANAKWDEGNKIEAVIDKYLNCLTDEKPITARQCIKALPAMAKYKPALKNRIEGALRSIDLTKYKENMQALIIKDIQKALDDIHNIGATNINQ